MFLSNQALDCQKRTSCSVSEGLGTVWFKVHLEGWGGEAGCKMVAVWGDSLGHMRIRHESEYITTMTGANNDRDREY